MYLVAPNLKWISYCRLRTAPLTLRDLQTKHPSFVLVYFCFLLFFAGASWGDVLVGERDWFDPADVEPPTFLARGSNSSTARLVDRLAILMVPALKTADMVTVLSSQVVVAISLRSVA